MDDTWLWDRRPGTVDPERDRDALLMQWLASDNPAVWRQAMVSYGPAAVRAWLVSTQGAGLSAQDAEFWRVVFDLPRGSMHPHEDLIAWTPPMDEDGWLALVA